MLKFRLAELLKGNVVRGFSSSCGKIGLAAVLESLRKADE